MTYGWLDSSILNRTSGVLLVVGELIPFLFIFLVWNCILKLRVQDRAIRNNLC